MRSPSTNPSVREQLKALRSGRAYFELDRDLIVATGEDRVRFLNGLVTCNLASLGSGDAVYGFSPSIQGRILTDLWCAALGDRLLLELPAGEGARACEHFLKYRIADRVELEVMPDRIATVMLDDGSGGPELPESVPARPGALAGRPARIAYPERGAQSALRSQLAEAGFVRVGSAAWETFHVEAGVLRFGIDFGPENFPQETGREAEGVSYDKGCYLGQEVIARIHYRGGVNRHPRGLRFSGEEAPASGAELRLEGRAVGTVGATARSAAGEPIGLAIVHRRGAEPGTHLDVDGAPSAEVVELPFADGVV